MCALAGMMVPSVHAAEDDTQEQEYNYVCLINTPKYSIMGGMRIFCIRWIPMSSLANQDNWLRLCWWMTKCVVLIKDLKGLCP